MLGRMMVSALALTGVAYAQQPAGAPSGSAPAPAPDCGSAQSQQPDTTCHVPANVNSSDRVSYDAAFFAQFNPQNALDMVNQTPGFSLNGGDDTRRGFSGAVGNLLIDGERPVAKSQSVQTILQQIPARQVVRIEVLRGAAVAGDASGQAVLVNVVRTPNAGSGVWSTGFEQTNRTSPQGSASWSGRSGAIEYGLGGSLYSNDRSLPGPRRYFDCCGNLTNYIDSPVPQYFREGILNGNFAMPLFGGRLSTTQQLDIWHYHQDTRLNFFDHQGGTLQELFGQGYTEHQWSFEIGANYDRDLGPWSLSMVSLVTRRYYRNKEQDTDQDLLGSTETRDLITQQRDSGETILRGALSRDFGPHNHIEFGVEGALNTLDAAVDQTEDTGSGPSPIVIPNANVTVQEKRAEAFVSYTWRPNDLWSVEARAADEYSILTFSGDYSQEVRLSYFKPSLQVSRSIGGSNQLRLRAYRDVGQLNFDDFTSRPSTADGLLNGGNPNLRPESDWRVEFGGNFNLADGFATSFALTRHWMSDAADLVELHFPGPNPGDPDILVDAPGNIGAGDAWSLTGHATVPFNFLLPNSRLTLDATLWKTRVIDPVTGMIRRVSGRSEVQFNGVFRQELPAHHLAWGIDFQKNSQQTQFRHNELDRTEEGPYIDLFLESTVFPGIKIRAEADDIFNPAIRRTRRFYDDPDRTGPLTSFQYRVRHFDPAPWLIFTVSGTF